MPASSTASPRRRRKTSRRNSRGRGFLALPYRRPPRRRPRGAPGGFLPRRRRNHLRHRRLRHGDRQTRRPVRHPHRPPKDLGPTTRRPAGRAGTGRRRTASSSTAGATTPPSGHIIEKECTDAVQRTSPTGRRGDPTTARPPGAGGSSCSPTSARTTRGAVRRVRPVRDAGDGL